MRHLGAGVVELSCLADGEPSRTQHQNLPGADKVLGPGRTGVGQVLIQPLLHYRGEEGGANTAGYTNISNI